jgi:hypothetical protein
MACNPVKFGQIITPCYGVMPSDPPQVPRPCMVSFLMVSRHLDRLNMPTAYMLTNVSKFPATWCARAAVGRRKTLLGRARLASNGHTIYALVRVARSCICRSSSGRH